MKGSCPDTRSGWHADDDIGSLSPAVMNFGQVIYDLVKTDSRKIGKLHFHNRLISFQGKSQCGTYDGTFTKWRIAHPFSSEFFQKTFSNLKGTSIFRNILAHQDQIILLFPYSAIILPEFHQ